MFKNILNESIIKRSQAKGKVKIFVHNLRDYTLDKHRKVDDRPFGGGSGMVMAPEPIFRAVEELKRSTKHEARRAKVILMSPQGEKLNQKVTCS